MDSVVKKQIIEEKRALNILGVRLFAKTDKDVSNYVSAKLIGIKARGDLAQRSYSLQQVIGQSINDVTLFGEEYFKRLMNILGKTKCYVAFSGNLRYACHVVYNVDDEHKEVIRDSGVVDHYKLPQVISELGPIFLGHEHIHALKETNYLEYQDSLRVGDVIPLFYELVQVKENYQGIYQIWLNARFYLLNDLKKQYDNACLMANRDFKNKDIYKLMYMRTGQYLNSFYYAVLLYRRYLDDKDLIIGLVNKVLNQQMTTLELLKSLGLYGIDNNLKFEKELNNLKKSL